MMWVGHSCPTLLTWVLKYPKPMGPRAGNEGRNHKFQSWNGDLGKQTKSKVKGVGQECPTHTDPLAAALTP
jgi:hypothetical protein